jgi:hypothetical protein
LGVVEGVKSGDNEFLHIPRTKLPLWKVRTYSGVTIQAPQTPTKP